MPERQQGEVESLALNQLADVVAARRPRDDVGLFEEADVSIGPAYGIPGDERHLPARVPEEQDEVIDSSRPALAIELGHERGAHQRPVTALGWADVGRRPVGQPFRTRPARVLRRVHLDDLIFHVHFFAKSSPDGFSIDV